MKNSDGRKVEVFLLRKDGYNLKALINEKGQEAAQKYLADLLDGDSFAHISTNVRNLTICQFATS